MLSLELIEEQQHPPWVWLRDLTKRFPAEAREFMCVFERVEDEAPVAWVAIGRLATVVCDVRDDAIVARLEKDARTLSRQVSLLDAGELPYEKLFSALASMLRAGRSMLPSLHPSWDPLDARRLQWFGGWKYLPSGRDVRQACCFTLPKLALRLDGDGVRAFNWGQLPVGPVLRRREAARPDADEDPAPAQTLLDDRMIPDRASYLEAGASVLQKLGKGECKKIVLSRKRVLELSRAIDPLDLYRRITMQRGHLFQYLISLDENETWVGISPELLLRTSGGEVETRPLAGSRRRGVSTVQDSAARESLLTSDKDAREHAIAVDYMFNRLQEACEDNSLSVKRGRGVTELGYIQHLATEMLGRLDPARDAIDALARIYPPATILGIPERAAASALSACEPFERSFFTGGIGVLSANGDSDVALCIRSAAVRGAELHLYAGSGYVDGSLPEDEWTETETKMQPLVEAAAALVQGEKGVAQ